MKGDPVVIVICDGCEDEFEARLTPLAGNCFDMRGVGDQLSREGWTSLDDKDYCSGCSEDDE